jgi:hypothetical protein
MTMTPAFPLKNQTAFVIQGWRDFYVKRRGGLTERLL